MNRITSFFLLILGLNASTLFSQDRIKNFEISVPNYRIGNSLYHSIDFLDSRIDTSNMGIVQLGAFNNNAKVVASIPLSNQLSKVIQSITDLPTKDGELLFQLWNLEFAEMSGMYDETGSCYIKAGLYSKDNSRYLKLACIDTMFVIKKWDVTEVLLNNGSKIITDFIASNLSRKADDTIYYSFRDIVKIDSTEKRRIKVYNVERYAEGLYYNYESFMNQKPDKHIFVETKKNGKISCVKTNDVNNILTKVDPKTIYAIVYNGKPYIATKYDYYPLEKFEDDFYFTGRVKEAVTSEEIRDATLMLGVAGGLLASIPSTAIYEIKLNHKNGGFIRVREIKYKY